MGSQQPFDTRLVRIGGLVWTFHTVRAVKTAVLETAHAHTVTNRYGIVGLVRIFTCVQFLQSRQLSERQPTPTWSPNRFGFIGFVGLVCC